MTDDNLEEEKTKPEIIPPGKTEPNGTPSIYAEIAAQINQYTDRPDLLLEVIEKHDPGFIKEMNAEARDFSRKSRNSRFEFGRFQAYGSTILAMCVAVAIIALLFTLAIMGMLDFWQILGLAIFYAVTQSGPSGFIKVVKSIVDMVKGRYGKSDDDK
ncbi:MFS transporter [Devosia sp.]|uniref:MFS transporter n=1 Tax=Devosia sp. TaxID=1871048 RepID=UPI001B14D5A0|nr:MFS transporter [Devosia sp.]MBO9589569.1 MFS transporter [Devosia sp.]